MKKQKNELNVDFIGGEATLTKDEEAAISRFIKKQKATRERSKLQIKKSPSLKLEKVIS